MRFRSWLLPALVTIPLLWVGTDALSCIRFKKPGGSVPPGLREPTDGPEPKDETPPPSTTPPSETPPPGTTPPPTTGPAAPSGPTTGPGGTDADPERAKKGNDDSTWETWWELNRIEFFPRRWVQPTVTGDGPVRAMPERLDPEVVKTKLWPMLTRCVDDKQMFVQEAALITMGRVAGTEEQKAAAREILVKKIRNRQHEVARAAALGLFYVADGSTILPMYEVAKDEKTPEDVRAFLALTMTALKHPMAAGLLRELADVREGFYELVGSGLMALGYNGIEDDEWIPEFLEKIYENGKARASYRALAVESFGRIGRLDVAHKVLLRAMTDREIDVRRSAVIALGCLEYRTAAEKEIEAIRAPYEEFVGKPMTPEDQAKIAELQTQIDPQREKTADVVRQVVKALGQAMEKDNDAFVRHMCAISLGRIARATPQSLAITLLEREWKQDKFGQREFALLALALAHAPSAYDSAVSAVAGKSRDPSLRCAGAIALGLVGDVKADPILRDLLAKEPHPHIRGYASIALGMIGSPGSADAILAAVKSTQTPVTRAYGALGLCLTGTKKGTDFLTAVLASDQAKDPFVSSHMVYALGLTKDRSQIDKLVQIADDQTRNEFVRSATIAAIGYVSSAEFYPLRHEMARGFNYMLNMDYISLYFYKL